MYYAAKDGGAYRDDTKIRTNPQKTLDSGYISVLGFRWKKLGSTIDTIYTKEGRVVSLISHAYAAAKVASGELIGAILAYGSPWDNAASALIVQKAGGVVTDLNGQPRRYDDFADGCVLSCNQDVHKELLKIVKNANNRH
jgi:fructose-1,6-bisphosphatase/inositol monophosphatase family enzyme